MFENLATHSLALEAEEQRTHSQDFQTSGLENYSKRSLVDRDTDFLGQRRKAQGRKEGPCCSSELILKAPFAGLF